MKLSVNGEEVFAATGGKSFDPGKPTVVFIHGAGFNRTSFQLQSRWFAWHGWSVLALDLPAHGESGGDALTSVHDMADWVIAVLDAADIQKAVLIGHSLGAAVALEAGAEYPERIVKIGMIALSDAFPVHPHLLEAARDNDPHAHELMTSWGHGPKSKIGRNSMPGMWMVGGARALLAENRPNVLHADLKACDEWDTSLEAASNLKCPALLVMGTHDMMTPRKKGLTLGNAIPNCIHVTVKGSGHMMMQEAPDAVLDALIDNIHAADAA